METVASPALEIDEGEPEVPDADIDRAAEDEETTVEEMSSPDLQVCDTEFAFVSN